MPRRYRNGLYGGYNQYSPQYQAAGFNPGVFGGSPLEFEPYDYSVYERGLANLTARMDAASEKQGAIDETLAKIELQLNPAEREWFSSYKHEIKNQIQGDIDAGNFGSAIRKANKLAGQIIGDSRILNRIEYNKEYQQERDKVLNDKTISQTRKNRWLEENPYDYKDITDDNGNVVSGTQWTPNWRPYSSVDMVSIYETVKRLAAVEAGGGESAQFLDENGNLTSDPSKGFYGMAVKRGTKWERLSADKLKTVFNKLFDQIPDAKEALLQQMDDRIWEYNKLDSESKKSFIGSDIIRDDGTFRTPQEYLDYMVNPVLSEMAYNHVWSSTDYGSAYANRAKAIQDAAKAQAEAAGRAQLLGLTDLNNTVGGITLELDMQDRAGRTYASIQNALKDCSRIPAYNTKEAKEFIKTRNFDGLADYLENHLILLGDEKRNAMQAINVLRSEGKTYNKLIAPLEKDEIEAAEFIFAKKSGAPLPYAGTNRYSREYSKTLNDLFSYVQNPGIRGNRTPVNEIGIQFQDNDQQRKVFAKLGLDNNTLSRHGLSLREVNGRNTLVIDKNTDILTEIADAFDEIGNKFWAWNGTNIVKFANDGKVITNTYKLGSSNNAIYELNKLGSENETVAKASRKTNNTFTVNPDLVIQQTIQPQPYDDFNTQILNQYWVDGIIKDGEYNTRKKEFQDNNHTTLGVEIHNLQNHQVYGKRDELGNYVKLSPDEIEEAITLLSNAYDENRIEMHPAPAPTVSGYGTILKVNGKEGKKEKEAKIYYVDALFDGPAAKAVVNNPMLKARQDYQVDRGLGIEEVDIAGNPIDYNNSDAAINQYAAKEELDNFYKLLNVVKQSGEVFTEAEAKAEATMLLNKSGYSEEIHGDAFRRARAKIVARMLNYYSD